MFDYTLHALFFSGGHHDFLHSGHLLSVTQVIPDWFELDLAGRREQGTVDPAAPANLAYLFPTANLANYTDGLVRPTLKHEFRDFHAEASYTRGIADYGQVGGGNGLGYRSNQQGEDAFVSSIDKDDRVTWSATYQRTDVKYDHPYTLEYLYEQARGEIGVLTIPTLRIIGRAGKESDPGPTGLFEGGLGSTFWAAGFDRSTGPDDDLKFLVGHRFFGRTYEGSWQKQARLLRLQVSYQEQPTTAEGLAAQGSLAPPPIVSVPGIYGLSRLSPDVFLDKSLSGAATITGRLTEIGLGLSSTERKYYSIATPGLIIAPHRRLVLPVERPTVVTTPTNYEDRYRVATLYARRRFGPLTDFNLSASLGKTQVQGFSQGEYTTQRYTAMLTRRLGRWSCWYVRGDHIRETGQIAEYRANIVSLGINVPFGQPPAQTGGGATSSCGSAGGSGYGM